MLENFDPLLPFGSTLVLAGMSAGLLAGLLGVGGGIVYVPVLYFTLQRHGMNMGDAMFLATGTSLAAIIPTSIASIVSHNKQHNIHWGLIRTWAFFVISGVAGGAGLLIVLEGNVFVLIFCCIALYSAVVMGFGVKIPIYFKGDPLAMQNRLWGILIGFFSVMAGIGGGTLGVMALSAYRFSIYRAIGTSSAFGLLISLPGTLWLLVFPSAPLASPAGTIGYVNMPCLFLLTVFSVLFVPIGVAIGVRLNPEKLKHVFAILLAVTVARMLMQIFLG